MDVVGEYKRAHPFTQPPESLSLHIAFSKSQESPSRTACWETMENFLNRLFSYKNRPLPKLQCHLQWQKFWVYKSSLYEVVKAATKAILDISSTTYSELILKKLAREVNKHTM